MHRLGLLWSKQPRPAANCFVAFLRGLRGAPLERTFLFSGASKAQEDVVIVPGASPWGLGAYIAIRNGKHNAGTVLPHTPVADGLLVPIEQPYG